MPATVDWPADIGLAAMIGLVMGGTGTFVIYKYIRDRMPSGLDRFFDQAEAERKK